MGPVADEDDVSVSAFSITPQYERCLLMELGEIMYFQLSPRPAGGNPKGVVALTAAGDSPATPAMNVALEGSGEAGNDPGVAAMRLLYTPSTRCRPNGAVVRGRRSVWVRGCHGQGMVA